MHITATDSAQQHNLEQAQVAAAIMIQRLWRASNNNKAKEKYLTADMLWDDASTQARLAVHGADALNGKNRPRQRWKRAAFLASRLKDENTMLSDLGVQAEAESKQLETQHWLELVDGKHRYGSNLKWYHKRWQEEDTKENFFKWLDYGGGKMLSLDQCSRTRLEEERILYLSYEKRLNYLVNLREDGKLIWAKNNQLVDTAAGHWKDAGDGSGIVPQNLPTHVKRPTGQLGLGQVPKWLESKNQENPATHYAGQTRGRHRWSRYLRRIFTPRGLMERLLKKTVKRNTWIYISDKNFNIFIGIKETGKFQHSTFLAGGLVTSAGLITVKKGLIHTLSPLSGHYRYVQHFRRFIEVLSERGVDMHKVKISKAEAALWGTEHLTRFKKAQSQVVKVGTEKLTHAPQQVKEVLTLQKGRDDMESQWKIDILHGKQPGAPRP